MTPARAAGFAAWIAIAASGLFVALVLWRIGSAAIISILQL